MVVSKKLVVVLVFCLYGIIHGKQVEDVESIADMKKILDRVLDEVTHLRLENKNMKSDNNNLQMKLKELNKSQTELLHRCRNVEKGNNKLNEKVPTSSIVAFSVVLDHEATLGPLQVVKYNKILTNVGNVYDPRHGHANIPMKGIYLVAVSSMNHVNEAMHVELVRNGDVQGMHSTEISTLTSGESKIVFSARTDCLSLRTSVKKQTRQP
ncbi:unnamed protein product [Mytilus edulis]|uniref:C1q domain-containing protein n=1 Tax=Mytilus edulis TaxID=6550 RepID=A0A8S3R3Y1_MYTED|nr:unnamed protein product [Mytilus edulis]